MEFPSLFKEFAVLLVISVTIGFIATRLRQPLIVAFIAVGILIGPPALGLVEHGEAMELLAEFGIAVLLFLVGLKLDLHLIRTMGPVALATGLGQIAFTATLVFLICQALGLAVVPSLYVAAGMSFSSTIIIVKLLYDKREIESLHGRIAIGFLIVQDIMVILTMITITAFGAMGSESSAGLEFVRVLLSGIALLLGVGVLMRYVLPWLVPQIARSSELLVLFSIALAIGMAALGDLIGFSKEVGAFLGGVALASTPYREAIGSRLVSVRDFLLLFFFISLGAQFDLGVLGAQVPLALLLSAFVLVGNPMIVMAIMGTMGFRRHTSFLSGLAVAQISEFSLILASLGVTVGHIDADVAGLITLVALITIGTSTYMILYSHQLYDRLAPGLRIFERKAPYMEDRLQTSGDGSRPDVIVFGLGRFGSRVAEGLHQQGLRVLGVDFDPVAIREVGAAPYPVHYGDAEDPEFLTELPIHDANWVISALPDHGVNRTILSSLREKGYRGSVAIRTQNRDHEQELRGLGSTLILHPYSDAADQAVERIAASTA